MISVSLFRDLPEERRISMEIYADHLAAGLRRLFPTDLMLREVAFSCSAAPPNGHPGGVVSRVRARVRRFVGYPLAAARQQGDVNHIADHGYADLVFLMDRRRTVVTCHDLVLIKPEVISHHRCGYSRLARSRFRWYSLRGLERASHVIADSESTRRDLLRHTNCTPDRVTTIPLGINPNLSPARDARHVAEIRRRYGIPDGPVVLHVGHVDFYKNIEGLLRVFARVRELVRGSVTLVRVGPQLTPEQTALASRLGLTGDLLEVGFVSSEQLPDIFRAASVFLFPSLYEGFGMPPLEAMASGIPVVSSNGGSLSEVVRDAGLLRSPADEEGMAGDVRALLEDRAQWEEFAEKGVQRSRMFSWERNAQRTREVYDSLLRHGRRRDG